MSKEVTEKGPQEIVPKIGVEKKELWEKTMLGNLEERGGVSGTTWGNSPGLPPDCSSPHKACHQSSALPTSQSQSSTHRWLW